MRDITAAVLVEGDGFPRSGKAAVAKSVFHVDENVGEIAMIDDEVFRGGEFGAASGLVGHFDLPHSGNCALELNCAGDGGGGGEIDNGDGLGLLWLISWFGTGGESESK